MESRTEAVEKKIKSNRKKYKVASFDCSHKQKHPPRRVFELQNLLAGLSGSFRRQLSGSGSVNAYVLAFAALVFEFDEAFNQGKERVVFTAADVVARLPFGAALAGDDISPEDVLAAEFL
jgi:hypothetical protein